MGHGGEALSADRERERAVKDFSTPARAKAARAGDPEIFARRSEGAPSSENGSSEMGCRFCVGRKTNLPRRRGGGLDKQYVQISYGNELQVSGSLVANGPGEASAWDSAGGPPSLRSFSRKPSCFGSF